MNYSPFRWQSGEPDNVGDQGAGRPLPRLENWSKGTILLNEFVIEEEIGEGGMGKVYLAKSRSADHLFAVKRTKGLGDSNRRNFQTELQVWIELPEYPHLVACRFFRTIGNETVIFAQYIEGGSLADWIRQKKLTSVPQILDVAIQTAWGLHTLHELGLVHHDIKPSNVLMTSDGLAKITDFGLAKARATAGELPSGLTSQESILVSFGGKTLAYCSPEQARGQSVSRRTDIWSWGVSVLEMFTGEVTWPAGQVADSALEEYWSQAAVRSRDSGIAPMPRRVTTVLRKCLRQNAAERWPNMAEIAEELKKVYRETSGRAYSRQMPPMPKRSGQTNPANVEMIRLDGNSPKAFQWLCLAYQAAGRTPPNPDIWRSRQSASSKVQAISDLSIYDEAQRIIQRLIESSRPDLKNHLAVLLLEKAQIHWQAEDFPEGLVCCDHAINLLRLALKKGVDNSIATQLATALSAKAQALGSLGEIPSSITLSTEAISIFESLLTENDDPELKQELADACSHKAAALYDLAEYGAALGYYDREIEIYRQLGDWIGEPRISSILACAFMNKGNANWASGNPRGALEWHDKAIAIWERMVKEGKTNFSRDLGKACFNKAITLRSAGERQPAVEWHNRAFEIYDKLVHVEGRWNLANELANVCIGKANVLGDLGQSREALEWFERAAEIYDVLANQQGHQEFTGDLARVRSLFASALFDLGEYDKGLFEAERAIPVLEREVARTGRPEVKQTLRRIQETVERHKQR